MTLRPAELEVVLTAAGALVAALLGSRLGRRERPEPRCAARAAALVALVVFAAYASMALLKYRAHNMGAEDLGRVDQAIWSGLHGRLLVFSASELEPPRPMSRLAGHVELLYVPLAALFAIQDSAAMLILAQAALAALGAIPAYRLGRRLGGGRLGFAAVVAYALHPGVGAALLADVHGDTLAMPLLLFALDGALARRRLRCFAALALAVSAKEYVAALAIAIGLWILARTWRAEAGDERRKDRRLAAAAIALGLVWLLAVVPAFHRRYRPHDFPQLTPLYYARLGATPFEVVRNSLLHPGRVLAEIATPRKVGVGALLLAPLAWAPVLSPGLLLVTAPVLVPLAVSEHLDLRNHHNATLVPFLLLAALQGLARRTGPGAPGALLAATLVVHAALGPSPFSFRSLTPGRWDFALNPHVAGRTPHDDVIDQAIATVPRDARVSATSHLVPPLAHRETCLTFPAGVGLAELDVAVVDLIDAYPTSYRPRSSEVAGARRLLELGYALTFARDGVLVLRRAPDASPGGRGPGLELEAPPAGTYAVGPLVLRVASDGALTWRAREDIREPILVLDAETRVHRRAASAPEAPLPWPAGLEVEDHEPLAGGTRLEVVQLLEGYPSLPPGPHPEPWRPDAGLGERQVPAR